MHLAVTGGCGYLGSVLLPKIPAQFEKVDFIDIRPPLPALLSRLDTTRYRYVYADLADEGVTKKLVHHYDLIVHLAGLVGYPACRKNPELAARQNVTTTQNILLYKSASTPILLASTISNYGLQNCRVDENSPTFPLSVYGETKKQAEDLVLEEEGHIVFRFAGAFGCSPFMRHDILIHNFVAGAVRDRHLSVYENNFIRQFIHIQDMADAILFSLLNWSHLKDNIFNVGNPKLEVTKRDFVEILRRYCEFECQFEELGMDAEKRNYPVSFEKLLSSGFQPRIGFEEGLPELIEYYREASQKYGT